MVNAMQAKKASLFEACLNTASGFVLSIVISNFYFWTIGANVTHAQNFSLVAILTVVSIVRSYVWRRIFNRRITQ